MEDRIENAICDRCDDLISFLYHELGDREARNFEQHLSSCAACTNQLASFREVRAGVGAWRDQSLGINPLLSHNDLAMKSQQPSALTAFREFFHLSPLWLKGAVAFASLLFFAVLAVLLVNLNAAKPATPLASTDKQYTEAELAAKVEAEVQARLAQLQEPQAPTKPEQAFTTEPNKRLIPKSKSAETYAKMRRAPLTRAEREQLAADLMLIAPTEDSQLNLLGEQINR